VKVKFLNKYLFVKISTCCICKRSKKKWCSMYASYDVGSWCL